MNSKLLLQSGDHVGTIETCSALIVRSGSKSYLDISATVSFAGGIVLPLKFDPWSEADQKQAWMFKSALIWFRKIIGGAPELEAEVIGKDALFEVELTVVPKAGKKPGLGWNRIVGMSSNWKAFASELYDLDGRYLGPPVPSIHLDPPKRQPQMVAGSTPEPAHQGQ